MKVNCAINIFPRVGLRPAMTMGGLDNLCVFSKESFGKEEKILLVVVLLQQPTAVVQVVVLVAVGV